MKVETDPITDDEWFLRIVYQDRFTAGVPVISPNTFEPRVKGRTPDTDGISLFREDCLGNPAEALVMEAEEKRPLSGVVRIPLGLLAELGLTVRPSPACRDTSSFPSCPLPHTRRTRRRSPPSN